jgi:DNA-binding NarL/FixJ family response regulator
MGVVICDPHQAFADAMAALLTTAGWHVLGCARDLSQAAVISDSAGARACVTELVPSDSANDRLLASTVASAPYTAFMALTACDEPAALRLALAAGVRGLALKTEDFGEIRRVLERCVAGADAIPSGPVVISAAARAVLRSSGQPVAEGRAAWGADLALTPREHEALRCLVRGESTEDIARAMGVQVATARGYLDTVLSKLGAHSRIEAVALAVRAGLAEIPAQRTATPGRDTRIVGRSIR